MRVKNSPVAKGIIKLSFNGKGKYSKNIATAAANNAIWGETKNIAPRKAKKKPNSDPSIVLSLLKRNGFFEILPPKIDAALSPKANVAIAAELAGAGNNNKVNNIPVPKYKGAAAKSYTSEFETVFLVIKETIGKFFLFILDNSDIK